MQVVGCGPFAAVVVFAGRRNTKSGAASPQMGETTPLVGIYSVVRGDPGSHPGCRHAALGAAGFGWLPPVQRLLQAALDGRELTMVVVAVDHLLDVLVLAVVAAVADVLLVAGPVADASDNAGTWPGSCHPWRHIRYGPVAYPSHPAQDAMRPRWCSAGQASPCRRRIASRAGVATQSAGLECWRKAQYGQGWIWRKGGWEEFGERSSPGGRVTRDRAGGNRVAATSARPVAEG